MPRVKKIPKRMCVGCQEIRPKRDMVRVVRTPDEKINIDPTGKQSGRGAYICPQLDCLDKALQGKRLDRALQRPITQEVIDALKQELIK